MENTYGIGVKNRYEVFYKDDEDPLEILRQQEEEKERKKAEKLQSKDKQAKGSSQANAKGKLTNAAAPPASATATAAAKKKEANATNKIQDATPQRTKDEKPRAPRQNEKSVKFVPNVSSDQKDVEERKNRRNREDKPPPPAEYRERGDEGMRGRGRGRGGGRGRGRGRGAGNGGSYDNRGKREFDRQSGSDRSSVKPMEKREGGGAHNWGTLKDDLETQMNTLSGDENQDVAERSGDEAALEGDVKEGDSPSEETKEPVEEGPREMTLDEWKKEQENKRSVPKFNLRKPGEGEDQGQWKKLYQLKKKVEDEEEEEEESDDDDEEFVRRGRQKQLVDIEINFSDSRRGRGRGRGGRGAGRGGPGRGGGSIGISAGSGLGGTPGGGSGGPGRGGASKNPKSTPSAPRVDDWNDFPSLVTA